jgi:cytochrome oxidase assembly protein ShyY1
VEGLVFEHPARVMNVGNLDVSAQKQKIQQNLDIEKQSAQLNIPHLPFILRQAQGGLDDGLQRDWAPMQNGSEKHKGYAFQWFSLATLTILFWLFSGLLRKKV